MKISATIITYNEEENIGDCIQSLKEIADEIIVVDSHSTDRTQKICLEKNVKFIQHEFEGHIQQKNFAMMKAAYDWILSLDADERISEELKGTIEEIKTNNSADAYLMNRLNNYCGKWIKHGVWYPDKKIRLWNKQKGKWGGKNPHDKVVMNANSKLKFLKGDMLHYTVRTREEYKAQMEKFSDIAAVSMKEEGIKSSLLKAQLSGTFAFIHSYILRAGFMDGKAGYEIAIGYSKYTRMKYQKTGKK